MEFNTMSQIALIISISVSVTLIVILTAIIVWQRQKLLRLKHSLAEANMERAETHDTPHTDYAYDIETEVKQSGDENNSPESAVSMENVKEPVTSKVTPSSNNVSAKTAKDNKFYEKLLEVFRAHMGDTNLSIEQIASEMGMERTRFYRRVKSITKLTPVELIRTLRLKEARQLLITTSKPISDIAYETGFSTPAYFSRCYREEFGETPTDTRLGIK